MNETFKELLAVLGSAAAKNIFEAVIVAVIGIIAIRLVMTLVKKGLEHSKLEKAAHSLILSILQVTLYVLLGLSVASGMGIDITGVVALASVLTLAVSLALQNMLTNVIGGFTVLTTQPFHSGDYVDIGATSGTVQEISMTYTRLSTPDNKIVSIPNSTVVAAQITNYSISGTRRVDVPISASYDADPEDVLDALYEAGALPQVLGTPEPFAALTNYGDNAIEYVLRVWVKTPDYWDVFFTINRNIGKIFKERGIEMTYPHVNVHMIEK